MSHAPLADEAFKHQLAQGLRVANLPSLLMVLYQLSGDSKWLREPYLPARPRGLDDSDSGGFDAAVQEEIRTAAFAAICAWREDEEPIMPAPKGPVMRSMLSTCMGGNVPEEYEELLLSELEAAHPGELPGLNSAIAEEGEPGVLIVGAGISGLAAAVRLQQAGIKFLILEKNEVVGGTWATNRYPGCRVDTPSYLYSFSYFPRKWSRNFAQRNELAEYVTDMAKHFGLFASIEFGAEVCEASYDEGTREWAVGIRDREGRFRIRRFHALITAVGLFGEPVLPGVAGMEDFGGTIVHSARWPEDLDLHGRRVAVVGTGASAMQVVPAIADEVAQLTIFQRSPQWIAPCEKYFREISEDLHWLMENVPFYHMWYRLRLMWTWTDHVHASLQIDRDWPHLDRSLNAVNDGHRRYFLNYMSGQLAERDDLITASTPPYPPFGKRMLLDNGWYKTLKRDNVTLVPEPIVSMTADEVVDGRGTTHEADIVIFCTGFASTRFVTGIDIRGRDGQKLSEVWGDDDASAYLGITVPRFPNLFLMYGPNTNPGAGGSYIFVAECQANYIVDLLAKMTASDIAAVDCKNSSYQDYIDRVDAAHAEMVWSHPGMSTYYRNRHGRVVTNLPWRIVDYWRMTRNATLEDYEIEYAPVRHMR